MKVLKRNGNLEEVRFDKITERIENLKLKNPPLKNIDAIKIAQKVCSQLKDEITTKELDELSGEICISLATTHPEFGDLAARITIDNHQKNTPQTFKDAMDILYTNKDINGNLSPLISEKLRKISLLNFKKIESIINYERDFEFDYFGFKTLQKSYLLKSDNKIVERPQHMWMRVSIGIHGENLEKAFETYNLLSKKYFIHATPTLFHSGTPRPQCSSCFLLGTGDSVEDMYKTISDCANISKWAGGIGLHISNIRARDSYIRGTGGKSSGIVPFLKVLNATARHINQCFTPETIIYTKDGPKEIQNVKIGDYTLTKDNKFKQVMKIHKNSIDKEILKIKTGYSLDFVRCTKEHEICVLRGYKKIQNFDTIKSKIRNNKSQLEFIPAGELNVDTDIVCFPKPKEVIDIPEITEELCRFYGIMLGDGHITKRKNSNYQECGVSLGISKHKTYKFVIEYLKSQKIHYWEVKNDSNTLFIRWSRSDSIPIDHSILYNEKHEKVIISKYMNLPNNKTIQLILGLIETDGSRLKEVYYHSTSKQLVNSIRYLLLRHGVLTSGYTKNEIGKVSKYKNITTRKLCYVVRIPKHPNICKVLEIEPTKKFGYFEYDDILYSRLKSIEYEKYTGNVYDLTIDENHNYTTQMGLVHNSGKRLGSIALYIEPWHADIFSFLEAKKNHGAEEERARDLFYALWIPDLFMKRVENDEDWCLMCPDKSPRLSDVYGKEFEELYEKYEKEGNYMKKIKARDIWNEVINSQIETGLPYMVYKDACNEKSNQKNVGVIKSSNLCVGPHTLILTENGYFPISVLAGMKVKLWNGFEFSESEVKKTGENKKLIEVRFSNGTSVQCTPEHDFYVQQSGDIFKIKANKLKEGMEMIDCKFPIIEEGYSDKNVDSGNTFPLNFDLESKIRWLQKELEEKNFFDNFISYGVLHLSTENRLNLLFFQFFLQTLGITSEITMKNKKYITLLNSSKLKKLQNFGLKLDDYKETSSTKESKISVVYVKEIPGVSDTFCFNEPRRHMGVFNGILAGNCTEIIEYSDSKEYAVCNLASISLPNFLKPNPNLEKLRNSKLKVYSKTNCEYCTLTKFLLKKHDIEFEEILLDDNDNRDKFFSKLNCKDGYCLTGDKKIKTVPQIFLGEKRIGDYKELLEYINPTFDHEKLYDVTQIITKNLNKIIDINFYPTSETELSNKRHRPIGIGVQGLADLFLKLKLPFDSEKAAKLNKEIFETIYFSSLTASLNLAKETGPYETFKGSPISEGKFQFDLWEQKIELSNRWDWENLRKEIMKNGIKNSLLLAPMPTASTSQILGNNECIEPYTSNIYTRRTLAGEFVIMNRHLVDTLLSMNLWNENMKQKIIKNRGSIQQIPEMSLEIKKLFKTSWEIKQKVLLDLAIDRGKFICQSQSLNVFCESPTYQTLSKIHFYGWKNGLKTGTYYIRSKPKIHSQQFTVNLEECENCSA